jgi:hypothetical protein
MSDALEPMGTDQARLAQELAEQARAEGVELVGPGGLLTGLTKAVLKTRHGVNVQVRADPAGRLIWASPALPDAGAATEHSIGKALRIAGMTAFADSACHAAGSTVRAPHRRLRRDPRTHLFARRELSAGKACQPSTFSTTSTRRAGQRQLRTWRVLRKIRSGPSSASVLVNAVQTMMLNS